MSEFNRPLLCTALILSLFMYAAVGALSCTQAKSGSELLLAKEGMVPVDSELLIEAGKGIGKIRLDSSSATLSTLGTPDMTDSAMGKSWLSWFTPNSHTPSGRYELNVFTTTDHPEQQSKSIRMIRITSPDFRTVQGLHTGLDSASVFARNPSLKHIGTYLKNDVKTDVYDDGRGLALEIPNQTGNCSALIVYPKDRGLLPEYGYFRPEMKVPAK